MCWKLEPGSCARGKEEVRTYLDDEGGVAYSAPDVWVLQAAGNEQ